MLLWNLNIQYRHHKISQFNSVFNEYNWEYIFITHTSKIQFSNILTSTYN
jgi:hypothetical protein